MHHRTTRSTVIGSVLLMLLLLTGCQRSEVDGIGSYTPDAEQPPQLDVRIDGCSVGSWGFVTAHGVVVNATPDVATYEVVVGFETGGERAAQGSAWLRDLDSGQQARFTTTRHVGDDAASSTCRAVTVNRWRAVTTSGA